MVPAVVAVQTWHPKIELLQSSQVKVVGLRYKLAVTSQPHKPEMIVRLLTQVRQLVEELHVRHREGQAVHVNDGRDAAKKPELHVWQVDPSGLVF